MVWNVINAKLCNLIIVILKKQDRIQDFVVSASGAKVLDSDEVLARWNVLELELNLGQHPVEGRAENQASSSSSLSVSANECSVNISEWNRRAMR